MYDYIYKTVIWRLPTRTNSSICFFRCGPANICTKHHPWITTRPCALEEITQNYHQFSLFSSHSDQRLVCQCSVQPSCWRDEVPWWKTDCAYHWTVLYLPAGLLSQRRKDLCLCQQQTRDHVSRPLAGKRRPWYRVLSRCFQPEIWWRHHVCCGSRKL